MKQNWWMFFVGKEECWIV